MHTIRKQAVRSLNVDLDPALYARLDLYRTLEGARIGACVPKGALIIKAITEYLDRVAPEVK